MPVATGGVLLNIHANLSPKQSLETFPGNIDILDSDVICLGERFAWIFSKTPHVATGIS